MPGLDDMARAFAAGGDGGMGADAGSPDMEDQDPNAPEDGPEMGGGDPCEAVEQAMQMALSGVEQFPGDLAEKARKHIEAILELCQQAEAAGGPGGEEGGGSGAPTPDGASDQIESPSSSGPSVGGSPVSFGA
jgi:hypothetical protein